MEINSLITMLFTTGTLGLHIVLAFILAAFVFRNGWGKEAVSFVGRNALTIGLGVSTLAVLGSLSYSNIVGFDPCVLCWWQRVFIYPNLILFLVALQKKDFNVFNYVLPLSLIGGIIAAYHSYVHITGNSILPCTTEGAACAKIFVLEYGYITIPMMSLTIAVSLITLSLIRRYYAKDNSNA